MVHRTSNVVANTLTCITTVPKKHVKAVLAKPLLLVLLVPVDINSVSIIQCMKNRKQSKKKEKLWE